MSDLQLDIDIRLNTPEAQAEAKRIREGVAGVGTEAAKANKPIKEQEGLIERLKRRLSELNAEREKSTNTLGIEKANAKIQEFQAEINRLAKIGKSGFDDMGKALPDFERPTGQLARMLEAANLYKRAVLEATSPEMLAKYNAKLEQTEATLKRMRNMGRSGFDMSGVAIPVVNQRPTSTLGRLKYAASAYQNMAANSNNVEVISKYNKKLQETQAEIGRVKNIGKDGFDALGNKITGSTSAVGRLWSGLRIVGNILPGISAAGILAFAIEPLMKYIEKLDLFSEKLTQAVKDKIEFAAVQLKGSQDAQRELTDLKLLYNQYRNNNLPIKERKEAYVEIQKMYPAYFGNMKFEQQATDAARAAYEKLTGSILATARARAAADKIAENSSRQLDNEARIKDAAAEQLKLEQEITKTRAKRYKGSGLAVGSSSVAVGTGDSDTANTAKITRLEEKRAALIKIQNDAKTDSNILAKRNLDLEAEVTKQVEKGGKIKGNVGGDPIKDTSRADNAALNHQRVLQQKIEDISKEYARKSQTKDEAELQAIRDKFVKIGKEVEKFNKNPKNKYKVDGSGLEKTRDDAISDLKYRQDTEHLKIALTDQKKLYDEFETYKATFGEQKAKERFGKQIDVEKTYLQQMQIDYAFTLAQGYEGGFNAVVQERLATQGKAINEEKANQQKALDDAYLAVQSQAEKVLAIRRKYVGMASKIGAGITDAQKAELIRQMDEEIKAANQVAFEKTAIYRKMNQQTIIYSREALKAEIKAVQNILKDGNIDEGVRSRIEGELSKLKGFLAQGVGKTNKNQLTELKKDYEAALVDPLNAGVEKQEEFKRKLIEIQMQIDATKNDGVFSRMFQGNTAQVTANISDGLGQLSGSFGELAAGLEGVNDELSYTLANLGQLVKVGSDAVGAFSSFSSGDIIGGITKTISAVAGIFSMGSKVRAMNEKARAEQKKYYDEAIKGERDYQALLRKREQDDVKRGKNSYRAIVDQLELLKKQSPEIQKAYDAVFASLQGQQFVDGVGYKHGTWFRKAKTWDIMASLAGSDYNRLEQLYTQGKLKDQAKADFESLKALKEELKEAGINVQELQKQLNELLTGTNVSGLADGFLSLFENGKMAAEDFGRSFEDIMRKAINNSFKEKLLKDALQPFYEEFAALFVNGTPNENDLAALKAKYQSIGEEFAAKFRELEKLTGTPLTDNGASNPNTIRGNVENITAKQADVLTGNIAGMRLTQIEGNGIAKEGFSQLSLTGIEQLAAIKEQTLIQAEIAANTLVIATNSGRLQAIEKALVSMDGKMSNNNNSLRAAGG